MLVTSWIISYTILEYFSRFLRQIRRQEPDVEEEPTENAETSNQITDVKQSANHTHENSVLSNQKTDMTTVAQDSISSNGRSNQIHAPIDTPQPTDTAPANTPPTDTASDDVRSSISSSCSYHEKPKEGRPKSGKVLKRKNTPAMLPKVEKIYAKDKVSVDTMMLEEDEEEEEEEGGKLAMAAGGS